MRLEAVGATIDRNMPSDMAMHEGDAFRSLIGQVRGKVPSQEGQHLPQGEQQTAA